MFSDLFTKRDKKVSHLIKLGDCLGRSLRENVMIFSIEAEDDTVTYLTESGKVITGQYILDEDIKIKDIHIQDVDVYKDAEKFDQFVNEKVSSMVSHIFNTDYSDADNSFGDILGLWENRLKIDSIQAKLMEKREKLASKQEILESNEFQNLVEVSPQLIEFLQENKEKVSSVPEIRNAVNLANTVSLAFDFPRMDFETLEEGKEYTLKDGTSESIYEMICRQELVKKELLESKRDFQAVWASNTKIKALAGLVLEESEEALAESLIEAIKEVPYLAMASKKAMTETFSKCLNENIQSGVISEDEVKKHSSRLFELKKDTRAALTESINAKYGINVANLTESISFGSLANTQVVIFEALSRLAPNASVLKKVLSEAAEMMKNKSGVESIDVSDYLNTILLESGYESLIESVSDDAFEVKSFKRICEDIIDEKKDSQYQSDETTGDEDENEKKEKKKKKSEKKDDDKEEEEKEEEEEEIEESDEGSDEPKTADDVVDDLDNLDSIIDTIVAHDESTEDDEEEDK